MRIEENKCGDGYKITEPFAVYALMPFSRKLEQKKNKKKRSRTGKLGNKSSVSRQHFSTVHFTFYIIE